MLQEIKLSHKHQLQKNLELVLRAKMGRTYLKNKKPIVFYIRIN